MQIIENSSNLGEYLTSVHLPGAKLGFVPTMGALHDGHLSLVKESVKNNDLTLCSIFINPTQFNNKEDLLHYPKSLEDDVEMLKNAGCDALFLPSEEMMYPKEPILSFKLGYLEEILEGRHRKGHFNGVVLIVAKLFNLVKPDNAYFGQKDLQQFVLLNTMVKELFFDITMVMMPIIRENDGLAMSSRNRRLSPGEREVAVNFFRALELARENLKMGMGTSKVKDDVVDYFRNIEGAELEYFEIVDRETLLPVMQIEDSQSTALCIAGYVGKIRLIDNLIV
jgi:pantoate--beta-alanine ligase